MADDTLAELEYGIMMFYTGIKRSASEILGKQQEKVSTNERRRGREDARHQGDRAGEQEGPRVW